MMSDFQDKEPGNVARGLEASLSNSNVPNDTKKRNFNRLNDMGEDYSGPYKDSTGAEQTKGYDGPASHTRQAEGEASAELTNARIKEAISIQEKETLGDFGDVKDSERATY